MWFFAWQTDAEPSTNGKFILDACRHDDLRDRLAIHCCIVIGLTLSSSQVRVESSRP